jgi:hypothetical protein
LGEWGGGGDVGVSVGSNRFCLSRPGKKTKRGTEHQRSNISEIAREYRRRRVAAEAAIRTCGCPPHTDHTAQCVESRSHASVETRGLGAEQPASTPTEARGLRSLGNGGMSDMKNTGASK